MAHHRRAFLAYFVRAVLPLAPLLAASCAAPRGSGGPGAETSHDAVDSSQPSDAFPAVDPNSVEGDVPGEVADRAPTPPPPPRPIERPAQASPYRVEVLGDSAQRLPTYHHGGRTYVLGALGTRYSIHVANPTGRRVEAVVSVDGLDAIDGRVADFVHKDGYVIAPYSDLTVDGFRTSMENVATFRFSSVSDSYAGRKGAPRNVGVIGVAFFPEKEVPVAVAPPVHRSPPRRMDAYEPPASPAPAEAEESAASGAGAAADYSGPSRGAPADAPQITTKAAPSPHRERSGLGTEFGEQRSSEVQYVQFQRANAAHPSAVAEIRYNDRNGLVALGILQAPPPSEAELRETASPFPGNQFASPPPPRY
jgi:hypothetical protein